MPRLMSKISLSKLDFPFLNRKNGSLPRGEMLALRPLRNQAIAWEMKTDAETPGANLTVPRREDKFGQIVSRIFQVPSTKTIELDEFGAAVWEKCDGRHSVEQLVVFTSNAYKLNRRQAEVSVVSFMRILAQRRLIGLETAKPNTTKQNTVKETAHVQRSGQKRTPARRGRRH